MKKSFRQQSSNNPAPITFDLDPEPVLPAFPSPLTNQEQPDRKRAMAKIKPVSKKDRETLRRFLPSTVIAHKQQTVRQHIVEIGNVLELRRIILDNQKALESRKSDPQVQQQWKRAGELYKQQWALICQLQDLEVKQKDELPGFWDQQTRALLHLLGLEEEPYSMYPRLRISTLKLLNANYPEYFFDLLDEVGPLLLSDEDFSRKVFEWWQQKESDPEAGKHLKKIGTILARKTGGRKRKGTPKTDLQIRCCYDLEYDWCRRFTKEQKDAQRRCNNSSIRQKFLAQKLNLPIDEVRKLEEDKREQKPSEWARKRTADKTKVPEERVRRVILSTPSLEGFKDPRWHLDS
jgi:hypothetical protein